MLCVPEESYPGFGMEGDMYLSASVLGAGMSSSHPSSLHSTLVRASLALLSRYHLSPAGHLPKFIEITPLPFSLFLWLYSFFSLFSSDISGTFGGEKDNAGG